MDDAVPFAFRNFDVRPRQFVLMWEQETLLKTSVLKPKARAWGRTLNVTAPPPAPAVEKDLPLFCPQIMDLLEETSKRARKQQLRWPRASHQKNNEKDQEILK